MSGFPPGADEAGGAVVAGAVVVVGGGAVVVLVAAVAAACTTATPTTSSTVAPSSASATASGHAPRVRGAWPTYHGDPARSGVAAGPALGGVRHDWTSPTLDGDVYAE